MNTHVEEPQSKLPPIQDFLDVLCGLRDWTPEELEKRNGNLQWYLEEAQNVAAIAATLSDVETATTELRRIPPLLAQMPTSELRQLTQQVVENWLPDHLVKKLHELLNASTPEERGIGGNSEILEPRKDDRLHPDSTTGRSIQTETTRVPPRWRRLLLLTVSSLATAVLILGLVAKFWHSTLIDASKIVATIAVSASGGSSPVLKSSGDTVRTGDVVVYEAVVDSPFSHRWLVHLNDRRATLVQFQAGASGQSTLADSVEMDAATCREIYAVIVSDSQIFPAVSNLDEISWLSSSCARLQSLAKESGADTHAILENELARIIREQTKTENVIVHVSFFKHQGQ